MVPENKPQQYALVAYLRGPLGRFAEEMRRELYPEHAHLAAHVTVLPPRTLMGSEAEAIKQLQESTKKFSGFDIHFGDVETFLPDTATVFIRVTEGADRFRAMHQGLNSGALHSQEPWPYVPHLTLAQMPDEAGAHRALVLARERWSNFTGERQTKVDELTFVCEDADGRWEDLETIDLRSV